MNDLISVIIPVYNVEKYLADCVDSVRKQSYKNLEIILVNDGSTDSCGELCDQYALADSRIHVIHQKNGGQSAARNAGLNQASGEWIIFVDSDDVIHQDMIKALRDVVGTHYFAMCLREEFTDLAPSNGEITGKTEIVDRRKALEKMFNDNQFIVVWGKIYHKSLWNEKRFREGIIYEDEDLLPELIFAADEMVCLYDRLYYYRIRPESTMTAGFSKKRLDIIGVCQRRIALFAQWDLQDLREKAVKDYYQHLKRLEKQTAIAGFEQEHILIKEKLRQWKEYGVRFNLYERLRQWI